MPRLCLSSMKVYACIKELRALILSWMFTDKDLDKLQTTVNNVPVISVCVVSDAINLTEGKISIISWKKFSVLLN